MLHHPEHQTNHSQLAETTSIFIDEIHDIDLRVLDLLLSRWLNKDNIRYYNQTGEETTQDKAVLYEQGLYLGSELWAVASYPLQADIPPVIIIYAESHTALYTKQTYFNHLLLAYNAEIVHQSPSYSSEDIDWQVAQYLWIRRLASHPRNATNKTKPRITHHRPGLSPQ